MGIGEKSYGSIGEPTEIDFNFPDANAAGTESLTIIEVDASASVSFAIDSDYNMYAWGDNDLGTLGVGNNTDQISPTLVVNTTNKWFTDSNGVKQNTPQRKWEENLGGYRFQIALDDEGDLWGWGYQKLGNIGALGSVTTDAVEIKSSVGGTLSGIVSTSLDGEFLIASTLLENYINSINYESYDVSSTTDIYKGFSQSADASGTIKMNSPFDLKSISSKGPKISPTGTIQKSTPIDSKSYIEGNTNM